LDSMQGLLDGYFNGTVVLEAPLIGSTKAEVVAYGRRHHVPLGATFSCTRAAVRPCGKCPSCLDRLVLGV
jgi:7-cyano-7-deazaguanine synthase